MWQVDPTASPRSDRLLPDVEHFIGVVNEQANFFAPDAPISVGRAPGRLDLMGGIADYSGSLVLELPLAVATLVAAQAVTEPYITIRTTTASEIDVQSTVSIPVSTLVPDQPLAYSEARALLTADPQGSWAAYVAGVFVVLHHTYGIRLDGGVRLLIHSSVPTGKGVSSSAALEVATMQTVSALLGLEIDGRTTAVLCQLVENLVVGAPCGIMDQMTVACGQQDRLLALLCQPAELFDPVPLPPQLEVWGIDSGIRHAVSGSDYGAVRVGAFMGYRILAELASLAVTALADGRVTIHDHRWHGYLANVGPETWATFHDQVPETIDGATFLQQYGGLSDPITRVDPQRTYAVRQPTAHPIHEHDRVQQFRTILQTPQIDHDHFVQLGELMYVSHRSYSDCGLGSDGTDRLVELVQAAGSERGLYGAKITGGGSGGTVAVLARRGSQREIERIAAQYAQETGYTPLLISGSSPGAAAWGVLQLTAR